MKPQCLMGKGGMSDKVPVLKYIIHIYIYICIDRTG